MYVSANEKAVSLNVHRYNGGGVTLYLSAYASDRMGSFDWHMVYRG
jgi:hypothetical protein